MQAKFWREKWERRETAFHEGRPNAFLVEVHKQLNLPRGGRFFLPLCGKTCDIGWLLQNGYSVAGAELSEIAVRELFAELEVVPQVSERGALRLYRGPQIDIWQGDIFELDADQLGRVDAVFDRAALVALPPAVRAQYAEHLRRLSGNAPQLLVTYEYNSEEMTGPPFSVEEQEVRQHYSSCYEVRQLASREVPGGFKGKVPTRETAWLLRPVL